MSHVVLYGVRAPYKYFYACVAQLCVFNSSASISYVSAVQVVACVVQLFLVNSSESTPYVSAVQAVTRVSRNSFVFNSSVSNLYVIPSLP